MARVSMVTRTIVTTEVEVLCMNIETLQVEPHTVTLLGGESDDLTMLKGVKSQIESETLKPVHITSSKEVETLYGMTEAEFISVAKVLPPRGTTASAEVATEEVTIEEVETPAEPETPAEDSKKSKK
jgi:hypothetical protein